MKVTSVAIGVVLALAQTLSPATAGDCKIQSVNGQSLQMCDNGYVEAHGRGETRIYGIRNGGVARYPRNSPPPYALERRSR